MHVSRRPLSTSSLASTASAAPSPQRYSDRFIPHRAASGDLHAAFEMLQRNAPSPTASFASENASAASNPPSVPSTQITPSNCYSALLKSELLDSPPPPPSSLTTPAAAAATSTRLDHRASAKRRSTRVPHIHPGLQGLKRVSTSAFASQHTLAPSSNLFRFQADRPVSSPPALPESPAPFQLAANDAQKALLSASPASFRLSRKIARTPWKVLDAPCLMDDFYLDLVHWSSENVLAVGLGNNVYLWSACTSVVTKLCDLELAGPACSVAWSHQGTELAVGTRSGSVQIWDTTTGKLLRTMGGHTARAGCLAWNSSILSSGGRDKEIFNRDLRCKEAYISRLSGHKQEVCGLKWSPDDMQLASGGNDNKLLVWNAAGAGSGGQTRATGSRALYNEPVLRFSYHDAAVRAIAWSPHARGLLASGGGTADKKIRFWNTVSNTALACVDTGSQVCKLAWSKNVNEIVSTHGYSQNQIIVWKFPTLSKVVTLMGHTCRVLYLSMSPTGETIVTGAGDETLRFWNVFPDGRGKRGSLDSSSLLSPGRMRIR